MYFLQACHSFSIAIFEIEDWIFIFHSSAINQVFTLFLSLLYFNYDYLVVFLSGIEFEPEYGLIICFFSNSHVIELYVLNEKRGGAYFFANWN